MFVTEQFGIFVDTESARYHFDHLPRLRFNHKHYIRDIQQIGNARIAAFHVPFPKNTEWLERFKKAYQTCAHTFVFCSELHEPIIEQLKLVDRDRVSIYLCGVMNTPFNSARTHFWLDWFHTSSEFYSRTCPGFLDNKLNPYSVKPLSFDVLLGNQRPHRDYVYNYINTHDLNNKMILTYHKFSHLNILENSEFIAETEGVEYYPQRSYTHSVDRLRYYGHDLSLSQVVPITLYNQTAYSIVAETNCFNHFNFYTEKIVKPMLARRLFVAVAGQHYLRNLRGLGFKTFSNIIDESYDSIEDPHERWSAAMDQVQWLSMQPQSDILNKIKPIAEHNYRLITEKNWYTYFTAMLESELRPLINNAKVSPASFA